MTLNISPIANQKINESILITGAARSGTTIIGKLIHSFSNVEYVFEPPMLFSLFSLIREITEHNWKILFETYLYEDFFLNAIAGRSINCNRSDDSSIYNIKDSKEIEQRLHNSTGKIEAEKIAQDKTIAFKVPDVVPFLPLLSKYYPDLKIVIISRDAIATINSLMNKRWFANDSQVENLIWPFKVINGQQIPFWVKEEDCYRWIDMSELDRCAYYYIRMYEDLNLVTNRIEINYNDFINNPVTTTNYLKKKLDLKEGPKTKSIIDSIQKTDRDRDNKLINKISPELAKQIQHLST